MIYVPDSVRSVIHHSGFMLGRQFCFSYPSMAMSHDEAIAYIESLLNAQDAQFWRTSERAEIRRRLDDLALRRIVVEVTK